MPYLDQNFFLRKRYFVCFWASVGQLLLYILRSNLSIALVEMTYEKVVTFENGTIVKVAPAYDWDSRQKGFILSLFNYGFYLAPLGGILAIEFGPVTTYGFGLAVTAVLTVLSPFLLRLHIILFGVARILEGVFEGISGAAMLNVFIYWTPPGELSRLLNVGYVGSYLGIFLNYAICGSIAEKWGYEAVFLITGCVTLIWYAIWLLFISNNPLTDRFITEKERNFFKNLDLSYADKKRQSYPWKQILSSKSAWAIFNEYFCYSWLYSFITACFPLYVKDVFNVNVQTVGLISSIPILANFVGMIISACIADYIRSNRILEFITLHRLFIGCGQLFCIVFLVNIGLWTNFIESVAGFTLMRFICGAIDVSYPVLLIDVFGQYAALVKGIGSVFGNTGSLLNPIIMGFMVTDHSRFSWNMYFVLLSAFNIFSLIIFFKFGSGKRQEWADPDKVQEIKIINIREQIVQN